METIKYKKGYKYQLYEDYKIQLSITTDAFVGDFFSYDGDYLTIKKGYAWDGPSGPTVDTHTFMRGSLVHDVLYQAMKEGVLSWNWKHYADTLLVEICKEDGMPWWRRKYVHAAVHWFGKAYSTGHKEQIIEAP